MSWTVVNMGKFAGGQKSLPQILWTDPDWFFWCYENEKFRGKGSLEAEANELYQKARSIRLRPSGKGETMVVEYYLHPDRMKLAGFEVVPKSRPPHEGGSPTFRKSVIDMAASRECGSSYDKLGCRLLIDDMKAYLFGSSKVRMTKRKCEEFFENDVNFELD